MPTLTTSAVKETIRQRLLTKHTDGECSWSCPVCAGRLCDHCGARMPGVWTLRGTVYPTCGDCYGGYEDDDRPRGRRRVFGEHVEAARDAYWERRIAEARGK